ncbi:MAG TPA: cation:proton antiporter [Chryseosolibacter sp.]|nr:cation:proton antiporter [Chryseosolibacter sp.]
MENLWRHIVLEFKTPFENSVLIFALILFIILFVPLLFSRFKIPGIIGLIMSGIAIGPHGLFLIKANSAVNLFSTIGLLYIMFIAGLELDLGEFRKNRNKSVVFGFLTFIIPLTIGLPVCYFLLDYTLSTSLLIASMFATHTLIAYPIVNRLGISKNKAVAITVGGTILTDTAVLLLLAVISGSRLTGLTREFWTMLAVSLSVFVFIVTFLIPRIASWFFRRMEDEKYAHFIFVLAVVFFCAFLAELSGLEPIIGAFAAGLTLNRLIPHTSPLMNRIEFVGNSLFIPFFLLSVGMIINLKVLIAGPQAIFVAITLTVVALIGKWMAAYLTGRIFRFSVIERNLIFGLSSSHAAATLAIILVGFNIGLIDENVLNGTVILILVTCVCASFVTEKWGKRLAIETDDKPLREASHQRIMVPVSNPATMERLLDLAIMLKNPKEQYPIIALTVVKDDEQAEEKLIQAKKMLDKAIIHAASADQRVDITATIDRNVASGIKRSIKEKSITDLVLGWSDDKNIADIIFGKTFDTIVRHTTQNIFITRFSYPLNLHRSVVLVCPTFAEKEVGFNKWVASILMMASRLRIELRLYAAPQVLQDVRSIAELSRLSVPIVYKGFLDLEAVRNIPGIAMTDLIVLVSSREGGISYTPVLDILPKKLSKTYADNNLIFVYPEATASNSIPGYEQEATGGILERGVELFQKAGRIFKSKK